VEKSAPKPDSDRVETIATKTPDSERRVKMNDASARKLDPKMKRYRYVVSRSSNLYLNYILVAASEESPVTHLLVLLTLAGLVNLGLPSLDGCRAGDERHIIYDALAIQYLVS